MRFADNLKLIRKERNISQEALAEIMGVSRQAISKWEQGNGYPETEKLLILSKKLNVSLDFLMLGEMEQTENNKSSINNVRSQPGEIIIKTYDLKLITCYKVLASPVVGAKNDEPKYCLLGVSKGGFWGEKSITLGWYADKEKIKSEIDKIMESINKGIQVYELKYAAKVKNKFLSVKL